MTSDTSLTAEAYAALPWPVRLVMAVAIIAIGMGAAAPLYGWSLYGWTAWALPGAAAAASLTMAWIMTAYGGVLIALGLALAGATWLFALRLQESERMDP